MVAVSKNIRLRQTQRPKVYTFEEYLRREEKALERHEFYNGQIIKVMGGTDVHSAISANIIAALKWAVRPLLNRKFLIYDSNLKIRIEASDIGVYPDALVICEQPQFWNNRRDIITNPLLIVEVLSPSTQSYDKLGKFELYKQIPSFQEYVLVNTDDFGVETRFQEETDLWRIKKHTNANDTIALRSLGTSISMADVYEHIEFGIGK
jgi:Uma2 family endonuclease